MNRIRTLALGLGVAALMVVVAACGQPESATPSPTVAPVDTPTVAVGGKLLESCVVTESGPRENPVLAARGLDPIPSGFDAGNHAFCTFAKPISAVKLELLRDGQTVLQQAVRLGAPTKDVRFPLSETPTQPIGEDLDTGGYDHRITAATEDGEETEVLFNADAIWVLDPDSSPKGFARQALIAAREAYAAAGVVPYLGPVLVAFEAVEWDDASLGCARPGDMYAQVITPGFQLVFEHESQRHELRTNRNGSTVVGCSKAAAHEPGPTGSPGGDTEPVIPGGAPLASLTYGGAVYYQDALSREEAANLNENDLELVGSTSESNTLAPGSGQSLNVYRLRGDDEGSVYTLEPGQSFENEDGRTITIEPEWLRWTAADSNETAPVSSGMMVPRPANAEELVATSDIIFVGTIVSVLEERLIGPYGEDGQPLPAEEDGLPYTDYEVRVEGVLKGDEQVQTLVLRMFGHLSNPDAVITPNVFTLPNPGDHLLFSLGKNPDGTYGSGPEGLLNIDGEKVSYADGVPFGAEVSPDQLKEAIWAIATGKTSSTVSPAGPLDTAWATVTILSVEDDMATMKIQEIRDYYRYRHATYPELNVGDEVLVWVHNIAPQGAVGGAGTVATAVKVGEAAPEIPQPVLIKGGEYLAEMSVCFTDYFGGLGCPYEGWSVAIYPLEQAPNAVTPTASPTPWPVREWDLRAIELDGATVTVLLHVFAGIDVDVTLGGRDPDQVIGPPPIRYAFQNVAPGQHAIQIFDVVGHKEAAEVVVPVAADTPSEDLGIL